MTTDDMFSGAELARKGITQTLGNEQDAWLTQAVANAAEFLRTHNELSSDDLYRHSLFPSQPHHPNVVGALMRLLRERGYMRGPTRWIYSVRPSAHSRRIHVYSSNIYKVGW